MKDFIKMFVASLAAFLFLFVLLLGMAGIASLAQQPPEVKKGSYLVIDVYGDILPYNPPGDIMAELFGGQPETLQRILTNLEKAAVDDRIAGVIIKVSSNNSLGGASMEEIRDAIKKVRAAGKKTYAFSDSMNRGALFLASACDSIFMPLSAEVTFVGMGGTMMYFKGLLDKLDIHANLHRIAAYKSAAEPFLRSDMSPEVRQMYTWMIDSLWKTQMQAIAADRGLSEDELTDFMEFALFTADQAKDAGLIDAVRYWDQVDSLLRDDDDELRTVSQSTYAGVKRQSLMKGKSKIAIVHAFGAIGGRQSRIDPMWGMTMGHESVIKELRRVGKDDDIKAVVFRVESGGGESLASDLIAREVQVLAEKKPVVTSMIDVAASGGYMISYRASRILADPMTITGSIGSIYGKANVAGLYNKFGVTFDRVSKGPNTFLWSQFSDFTPAQRARFEENHWNSYNIWFDDVSAKRGIPPDQLEKLTSGRVWTGLQASENGLVDDIGGLAEAIDAAKELAGIPLDENVELVNYPRKKGLLELILSGSAPKTALRWALYRFIRDDLADSIQLLINNTQLSVQ